MTHDLLIHGGRLILRDGDKEADLSIRAGKVAAIGKDLDVPADCPRLDASGHWVFPGLIDPQVHFREPGLEHKEDLASGSLACVAGGVTAFCEMPDTTPPTTDPAALQDKFERAAGRASADHAFFLGGHG